MAKLKILLVAPAPPPNGGIGRWTVLLLDWLKNQNDIEFRHIDISPRWRAVDDLAIKKRLAGGSLQGARDAWQVFAQLVRFRLDVLHLTTSGSLAGLRDVVVLGLARCFGVASVYHIHMGRLPELAALRNWEWRLLKFAMRLAGKVVVLDRASESALKTLLPAGKVLLVPNGINLRALTVEHNNNDPKIMLFLGWVVPTKGLRELMVAWRQLRPQNWELRIAGEGSPTYQRELQALVRDVDRVRFLGVLSYDDAAAQMRMAEVFVLPTYTEGFPNVILEAMAAGKPIVTTSVGAIPEMLDMDSAAPCGLLIEPRDVPALVQALRRIMDDEPLRRELGRRARARVERCYDTGIVFHRLAGVWRESAR